MMGVTGVTGGVSGVRVSMVGIPMGGLQAPSPTVSGHPQAEGPVGSWEGVEQSRASIWGSQRGGRSHSGDPRPSALPALETLRLGVQRGPGERSLK